MSTTKKRSSLVTGLLFVLAIGLLLFSAVGSARAALNVQSEILTSDIRMLDIGVELDGKGGAVSGSALLDGMLGSDSKLLPGKVYDAPVSVKNSGIIDEYVRVVVYKYWKDASGKKTAVFDPSMIELGYASGWTPDNSNATSTYKEQEIWYYTGGPLEAGDSIALLKTVMINDDILTLCTQKTVGNKIYTIFEYDGAQFCVEIEADGVQTHNAQQAILSAWGKTVSVTDGGPISGIS